MFSKGKLITIGGALSIACAACFTAVAEVQDSYSSPYRLQFTLPRETLTAPDLMAPRNDTQFESETPAREWYSARILRKFGAWGPGALSRTIIRHHIKIIPARALPGCASGCWWLGNA